MDDTNKSEKPRIFPIIGLGASAGGLEALRLLFESLHPHSGMAFVVVQHLSPHQESILHELIQRYTTIPVQRISEGVLVQPDNIYVLPAGYDLHIHERYLSLTPLPPADGWPETISRFFRSLAEDIGAQAAAVILSGAGHDGTLGAQSIKEHGGVVVAQDVESAAQSSMPFSVADAGLTDAVLSPEMMPNYLLSHFGIDVLPISEFEDLTGSITTEDLQKVVVQLQRQTSYDFGDYKLSTLRRQIARRLGVYQLKSVTPYLSIMEQQPGEARALVKGLLINVTSFFRDPDAFESLRANALLPLLKTFSIDDVFRAWVPGCASGEEAISIAILIYECLRELNIPEMDVRIFATDMNHELIQRARGGVYPASIVDAITPARLKDHFIATDDGYHVRTHINRMIVWADHNLIDHPPFSGLGLISCRNVLIYFQPKLQERIRALFQFALRPEGILFLGTSEAIPDVSSIFTVVDSKQKIYRRTTGAAHQWMRLDQPLFARLPAHLEDRMSTNQISPSSGNDHKLNVIKSMLLTHYNSTCAIVDEHYYVRYTYGEIDRYLRLVPGGEVQTSILNMAREGLNSDLTIALYEAYESENIVIRSGIWMQSNGAEYAVTIIIRPIQDSVLGNRFKLVIFEPDALTTHTVDNETAVKPDQGEGATIKRLRDELQQTRQALQSATQALQAKSEELSSSMEEISSANEEVQTTNEELRTSKEELESMNEELNTLNSQLTNQNLELTHANNTLYNFLQSTEIGVIFLDQNLAIREYTQAATAIFSLRKSDVGRPLAEITSQLTYNTLIEDAMRVLDTLVTIEHEVATQGQQWYKAEIRPYRTMNNAIDGLVLTFTDVTLQKQAQQAAERTTDYMRQMVDTVENGLLEMDGTMTILSANQSFYQQFQVTEAETVGNLLYNLGNGQWNILELRQLLNEIIPQQTFVRDYTVTHDFPGIGRRTMRLNARRVKDMNRILLVITDGGTD